MRKLLVGIILLLLISFGCRCPELVSTSVHDTTYVVKHDTVIYHDTVAQWVFFTDTVVKSVQVPVKVYIHDGAIELTTDTISLYGFGWFKTWVDHNCQYAKLYPEDTCLYKIIRISDHVSTTETTHTTDVENNLVKKEFIGWWWLVLAYFCGVITPFLVKKFLMK